MKITGLLAICATVAMSCSAQETLDVSGLQSWGLDGDADNETMALFPAGGAPFNVILEISYDLTIETIGGSWLSEVNVRFGNSTGTFDGNWPDTFTPGFGSNFNGTQRFTGSFFTDFHLNADGELWISLFESFDDNVGAVDAIFLPGSTITVGYFLPSPGTGAILGMGAFFATRRRR